LNIHYKRCKLSTIRYKQSKLHHVSYRWCKLSHMLRTAQNLIRYKMSKFSHIRYKRYTLSRIRYKRCKLSHIHYKPRTEFLTFVREVAKCFISVINIANLYIRYKKCTIFLISVLMFVINLHTSIMNCVSFSTLYM